MAVQRGIIDIREYKARRRRAGNIRWILILIFLIVCLFAGYYFARSDFFTLRSFVVEGNAKVDDERIIELTGMHIGENVFSITADTAEQWVKIEPKIKTVEVSRRLPGTVVIRVEERQAVAVMNVGGAIVEIDDTGKVLSRYRLVTGAELPLISGVDLKGAGAIPGATLAGEGMAEALNILNSLPEDAADIGEINVSNPQYIRLYTISGTEIRLGDCDNFADKYLVYSNILKDHEKNGGAVLEYIDVSTRVAAISTEN